MPRRISPGSGVIDEPLDPGSGGRIEPTPPPTEWPDYDFPDPGDTTPGGPGDSGPPSSPGGSYSERMYNSPSTILGATIPMVYGSQQVSGFCAAWNTSSSYLDMAFVFCFGEQAALGTIKVNDEAISGLSWVTSYNTFLGSGSGTQPSYMTFMSAGDWTTLMGFACVTMRVAIKNANCPGSFTVTAVPTGRKFASFRSPYTVSNHTNLAEVAYDILTADAWKGLTSPAGTASGGTWDRFASHCDEVMGDASKRYTFNGAISERDPDAAMRMVLDSGFAGTYFSSDGKYQIWSEAPPPAITGTWTAAGTTVTEDTSSGAALTDLTAGDIVYVGVTPCIVSSVTNDDTFVVDRSVTQTSVKTRKTSGVYLRIDNWVEMPTGREVETGTIPDEVVVRYTLSNYWGDVTYPTSPSGDRQIEVTVEGCNSHSMARRISETKKNLLSLQPFTYRGVADAAAAGLEPGDVFFFDDDVLTFQPVRVLPPVEHGRDGNVQLRFQTYSISTVSDSTQANPSIPTQPTAYQSDGTPHFGAINSVTVGGIAYNFFRWDGSDAYVGDDTVVQVLDGVSIRLPNDVALLGLKSVTGTVQMLKVNASDQLQLGDGTVDIYLNSPNFVLPAGGAIQGSGSPAVDVVAWKGSAVILGGATAATTLVGSSANGVSVNAPFLKFDTDTFGSGYYESAFRGVIGRTSGLTTTELPTAYDFAVWRNTSTNEFAIQINYSGSIVTVGAAAGSDSSAIHDDVAAEISAITAKTTPVAADLLLIEDSAASNAKKKMTVANLMSYGATDSAAIHNNVAGEINALSSVTAAVTDLLLIEDASATYAKAKLQLNGLPHLLKSGGTLTGDVTLANTIAIAGRNAADTASYNLVYVNASNQIKLGSSSAVTYLDGSTLILGGTLTVSNGATFNSTVAITGALTLTGNLISSGTVITVADDLLITYGSAYQTKTSGGTVVDCVEWDETQGAIHLGTTSYAVRALNGMRLPNNKFIVGAKAASATVYYNLIGIDSSGYVAIGNTSCAPTIQSSGSIFLGGVSTYFQGSGDVILEGATTGMNLILMNDYKIYIKNSSGTNTQCVTIDASNNRIFGWTTGTTWVEGATLKMYGAGYSGTVGPPTTTQWSTAGSWGIHVDTDGYVYLAYNHGGTIKYKLLDNT